MKTLSSLDVKAGPKTKFVRIQVRTLYTYLRTYSMEESPS